MPQQKGQYFLLSDDMDEQDTGLVNSMEAGGASSSPRSSHHDRGNPEVETRTKSDIKKPPRPVRTPSDSQNFIMMYSNELDEGTSRVSFHRQASLSSYYLNMEMEENIKCIVTTALIIAIITALLIVTFIVNPEM